MNTAPRYTNCRWLITMAALVVVVGNAMSAQAAVNQNPDAAVTGETPSSVTAQWQSYDLLFHYFGFTTYYSCSGLEDRLKQVLIELGSDPKVKVNATGCFGSHEIGNMLSAHIQVRMPTAQAAESEQTFAATSKPIKLLAGRPSDMGSGDCELLERVRDQLLPALKLQLIKDDLMCIPGQGSVGRQGLQVRALIPTPVKP